MAKLWTSFQLLIVFTQSVRITTMAGASAISSAGAIRNSKLKSVEDIVIDKSGKFKYILMKVHDPDKDREFKHIVRGHSKAHFHGM